LPQNESKNLLVSRPKAGDEDEQAVVQGVTDRFLLDRWLDCNTRAQPASAPTVFAVLGQNSARHPIEPEQIAGRFRHPVDASPCDGEYVGDDVGNVRFRLASSHIREHSPKMCSVESIK